MEVYLVGGAVRDELLGRPVTERDWVVVGATPREMLDRGFTQVGRDFPVFLHPRTHEEYALARTERKTAPGYHGFEVHAEPDVTLEQDLGRRDLTINAMARDEAGELVDPFGGREDLQARLLRHVSPAFREDPVRILRVARFAARFAPLGFHVADETRALMREMVDAGEFDHLVPERVWQEMARALAEPAPARFFEALHDCGGLAKLLPELAAQMDGPGECYALRALEAAAQISEDPRVRFAALLQAAIPADGADRLDEICDALRVPNEYRELVALAHRLSDAVHRARELDAGGLMDLLERMDAFRRGERVAEVLRVCRADAVARGLVAAEAEYPPAARIERALEAAGRVDTRSIAKRDLAGPEIGEAIRAARVEAVADALGGKRGGRRPVKGER